MADKHVWEGKVWENSEVRCAGICGEDGGCLQACDIVKLVGIGKRVRITVEVLETAGGATKEAVQHES